MTVLLTRRATLQAAVEATYNVAVGVDNTDGYLVESPDFSISPNILERNYTRADLSMLPFIIGRKIAKMEFTTELRGNGREASGAVSDAPVIARLFQACGYKLTGNPGATLIGPYPTQSQANPVTWTNPSMKLAADVLTTTGAFTNGDTVTVGGKTYTMQTVLTNVDGNVWIGGSTAAALANLAAAINLGEFAGVSFAAAMTMNTKVSAVSDATTLTASALTPGTAGNSIGATVVSAGTTASWAASTLLLGADAGTNTDVYVYYATVTTGGASGTAEIAITSDLDVGVTGTPAVVTSGTPIAVGSYGLSITPTWTGNLALGQGWTFWLMPPGLTLKPVSDNFESLTMVMNKDGVQHTMPGSLGTFELTAEAGSYAKIKWTFTGTYVEPIDARLPLPNFETTLPWEVQLARLQINSFGAIVAKFTYNQGNDIQIRPDVSGPDGYLGVRLVSRKPEGGIDPEADLVENFDFWGQLSAAETMPFSMRVGIASENEVWFIGTNVQYSGLTYQDRAGISTYNAGIRFARQFGDDEVFIHFC